ncbi:anti-sigma B factor RsbW [Gorillibacterium sp. CAU 1737]|uniref:anti-sigma B factor RsbW n=1 Tax=Gorillibacterium sp. CAU 1737 TaxID=3140362 RepID=UPI0032613C98
MNHEEQQVQLIVPADAHYVDIVRLTLYGIATKWGFSYEDIEDMKVAVAEACNNAVLHAYKDQEPGKVEVTFSGMEGKWIRISVKDQGASFDYHRRSGQPDALHNKQLDEIHAGGLGIYMMQALMDEVQVITEAGTEVILTKFLERNGELA